MRTRFPTLTDLEFYRSRQELPAWTVKLTQPPKHKWANTEVALIDLVVNSHAGIRTTPGEMDASNLLSILRSGRRRGVHLESYLAEICKTPLCAIRPAKRAALARKWAYRIQSES